MTHPEGQTWHPGQTSLNTALSSGILGAAIVLQVRAGEGSRPVRSAVRPGLRLLAALLSVVTVLMLAAGTVGDRSGPLADTITDSHGHRVTVPSRFRPS